MPNTYKFLDKDGLDYFRSSLASIYKTESQINSLIATALNEYKQDVVTVASSLPATGVEGILYMIPNAENSAQFDCYVWEDSAWKPLAAGSASVDLSNYYTKSEVNSLVSGKANTGDVYTKSVVDGLLDNKVNTSDMIAISNAEIDAIMQ